jgi:HK97 gp10 family phage protein
MIESNTNENISAHAAAKKRAVLKICQAIEGTAVMLCPVDKGDLRASIGYACELGSTSGASKPTEYDGIVTTNKEHAPHVEFGTRPHTIAVKFARVLSNGKDVFGTIVNHPGTRAQPFMRPALDQNVNNASAIMRSELSGVSN